MGAIIFPEQVRIPVIKNLNAFRRWARSEAFPEHGWFSHLDGDLWVDLSMEQAVHNLIKSCFCTYLTLLTTQEELGPYFGDRMLLTHVAAGLSTEPDGMFLTYRSLQAGRVRLVRGKTSLEVLGTPDMTLEVISPTSVEKDTVVLRHLYWLAGVAEYWLVDGRAETPRLEILRRVRGKYRTVRRDDEWVKSAVFGKSFRLACRAGKQGIPVFMLEVR